MGARRWRIAATLAALVTVGGAATAGQALEDPGPAAPSGTTTAQGEVAISTIDPTNGEVLLMTWCTSAELDYALDAGDVNPAGEMSIGSVTGSRWVECREAAGSTTLITQSATWPVVATTGLVGGVGTIRLDNISVQVSIDPISCTFTATGSAKAEVNLTEKNLQVTPGMAGLTISDVTPECEANNVYDGDEVQLDGVFNLS